MKDKATHFFTALMMILSLVFLIIAVKTMFSGIIEIKAEEKKTPDVVEYWDHKHVGKSDSLFKTIATVHLPEGKILNSNVKWVKKKESVMATTSKKTQVSVNNATTITDTTSISGEKLFGSLGCVACHGVAGKSVVPMFPVLAGKDAKYIVKQLKDFQSGARPSPMMKGNAIKTKGNEQAIADYLAMQK